MLAVGVEGDDDLGAGFDHQPVAGAQRRAAAAVGDVAGDRGAVLGGDVAGAVAGAVVDDQDLGRDAADLGRHLVEHVADVLGLVVGGDEDRDLAAEALRQARLAELLPGQPLERRRELARVARGLTESARRISRKRMKIAKTARPRMRPPLPFSKEKAESSSSVISVPETSARPSPAASRISTSALRSERRRTTA